MQYSNERDFGDYIMVDVTYDEEDSLYIPEGCRACGGDYPHCKDSCPMFDE